MTVIHNHPHPLAKKIVEPVNPGILSKYGKVRVEDWDDRVSGFTWPEHLSRGSADAHAYWDLTQTEEVSANQKLGQQLPSQPYAQQIVRCHTVMTGEIVRLHDDWLPRPDQEQQPSE